MKRKKVMNAVMLFFILAIFGTTIAYAVLSSTLKVSGNAIISDVSWDIHFENLQRTSLVGSINEPIAELSDTLFKLQVELYKPLDAVTYTFDVKNAGSIDAKISTIVTPDIAAFTSNQLTYTFTYADGSALKVNDMLKSGETKHLTFSVKFNDVNELNSNSMSLSLDSSILYVQA